MPLTRVVMPIRCRPSTVGVDVAELRIIERAEWGAVHGDGTGTAQLPASEVWLHHSVTAAPDVVPPFDDDGAAIRAIERIGMERFGTAYGFPYTFGVTPAGRIYAGHAPGQLGAHTAGRNVVARAIVLVGNYVTTPPTTAQVRAVAWLLQQGQRRGWWRTARLSGGHRDAPGASTECPGAAAMGAIAQINKLAAGPPIEEDDVSAEDVLKWHLWTDPNGAVIKVEDFYAEQRRAYNRLIAQGNESAKRQSALEAKMSQLAADVAELKSRPTADVDEAALATELHKRGIGGATADEVLAAIRAQLNKA